MMIIKKAILSVLNIFGYTVLRSGPQVIKRPVNMDWLNKYPIGTFVDIGANVGEYIDFAAAMYPAADIYAFEPLRDCYEIIRDKEKANENLRTYNLAIGAEVGAGAIFRSSYAPSSSLLKMGGLHEEAFPHTKGHSVEQISMTTLDHFFEDIPLKSDIFIKVDTQGYEDRVIAGGQKFFRKARIVLIEVSFDMLYEKQELFHGIYGRLYELGFAFKGVKNQIYSPVDGAILQAHAYFIK